MKFFLLTLVLGSSLLSSAQPPADTSFRLFWYEGKKLSPNSLLRPGGDTVFYQPAKNSLRYAARKGSNNQLAGIQAELNRTPQRLQEMTTRFAATMPKAVAARLSVPLQEAYSSLQQDWKEAVSNVYDLPALPDAAPKTPASDKGGPWAEPEWEGTETVDEFIAEANGFIEKLKTQKISWVPTPPREELTYCQACDDHAKDRLRREREEFEEQFYVREETEMVQRTMAWARWAQLRGSEDERRRMDLVFWPLIGLVEERMVQRCRMLMDQYLDKPEYHASMMPVILTVERQRQLLGRSDSNGGSLMDGLTDRVFVILDAYLQKAASEFNYGVMLNAAFIFGAERQKQLLGASKDVSLMQRYFDFNRFKMSINISNKVGGVDYKGNSGYIVSQLRGDNYFSAVPDEGCKLRWVLMGPDKENMKFKLEAGEIIGSIRVQYIGTKAWEADKPLINLDFCQRDPDDTVIIRGLFPVGRKEMWLYPAPLGAVDHPNIRGGMIACFMDKDRLLEEARSLNMAKMEKMKKDMMAKQQQFMKMSQGLRGKDPSKMTPAEMARFAKAAQAASEVTDLVEMPVVPGAFFIKTKAGNRNKIVFKEKLDGRELFPENTAIQYAYFHIQLEQYPGSPYKLY